MSYEITLKRYCIKVRGYQMMLRQEFRHVPFIAITTPSFTHSSLITGFVTRGTQRVPLEEQELMLPEHM
jgi:hypothetical protein